LRGSVRVERRPRCGRSLLGRVTRVLLSTVALLPSVCLPVAAADQSTVASDRVIYRDTVFDPSGDQSDASVDILRASRTIVRAQGTRYLRLAVLARQDYATSLGSGLRVESRLDTRGGPRADYQLVMNLGDFGSGIQPGCFLWKRGDRGQATRTHLKVRDSGAISCGVPVSSLRVTQRVHWWLLAYDYEGETADYSCVTDRAPETGWYP